MKDAPPKAVAKDYFVRRVEFAAGFGERSPEAGAHSEHRKQVRGNTAGDDLLRVTGAEVTFEGEESEHRDDGGKTRARRRR